MPSEAHFEPSTGSVAFFTPVPFCPLKEEQGCTLPLFHWYRSGSLLNGTFLRSCLSPVSSLQVLGRRGLLPQLRSRLLRRWRAPWSLRVHHTDGACTPTITEHRREWSDEQWLCSEPSSLIKVALRSCSATFASRSPRPCPCLEPCSLQHHGLADVIPSKSPVIAGLTPAAGPGATSLSS